MWIKESEQKVFLTLKKYKKKKVGLKIFKK